MEFSCNINKSIFNLISQDEFTLIVDNVKKFTESRVVPMLQNDFADGDLTMMETIIDEAYELGIITTSDENSAGYEMGIWGTFSENQGVQSSLIMLSEIAKVCGSAAFVAHHQGLAANCFNALKYNTTQSCKRLSFAFQNEWGMPYVETLLHPEEETPAKIETTLVKDNNGYVLNGSKFFVYHQKDTDFFLVPALYENKWSIVFVHAGLQGISYQDVGQRTGLRFLQLHHLQFNNVRLSTDSLIANGPVALDAIKKYTSMHWYGMSAIALGIAQGALLAAKQFSKERYQGGTLIKNHAAIQFLLSSSFAKVEESAKYIHSCMQIDSNISTLRDAAVAKLNVLQKCSESVTDALQVFGGYGYMQDFRIEKRLRDIQVLKLNAGSPIFLKKFIYDMTALDE